MKKTVLFLAFGVTLLMSSCKDKEAATPSLYSRLGGFDAIAAVTDQFIANVAADNSINGFFAATVADPYRLESFRNNLVDQICAAAGGPCTYKGETMVAAHTGMNITEAEFNALVADLVASLNQFNVPATEQTELLTILGSLKSQVVGL